MRTPLLLLCAAVAGCTKAPPATPEAAYSRFVRDVALARSGEDVGLLEDFDAPTRAALTARAAAASQASSNRLPADPVIQLLQGAPPSPPVAIHISEQSADRATLEVQVDAGASGPVVMVREGGRWRVHLELEAAAPLRPDSGSGDELGGAHLDAGHAAAAEGRIQLP